MIAAADPPRQLETSAIDTPIHSLNALSPVSPAWGNTMSAALFDPDGSWLPSMAICESGVGRLTKIRKLQFHASVTREHGPSLERPLAAVGAG